MRRLLRIPAHHLQRFIALEASGGIVMMVAAFLAIALANSPLSTSYLQLIDAPLSGHMTASLFIKDVLMAIFFFAIGMELKYEMREGALAAKGQKALPLFAALGGIVAPALIYLAITRAAPALTPGWAVPTATDIAFALCVLRLVGRSVPHAAKMFLLAIAIYDDLAAIVIIAVFYATGFAPMALLPVAGLCAVLYGLNRAHISHPLPYLAVGALLWFAVHHAGIHPTVAGVITGIAIPLRRKNGGDMLAPLLHRLHPFVAFAILPLFAFTSAGVDLRNIRPEDMLGALPLGITLALFIGKPLGIVAASWACVRLRIAPLPGGIGWKTVYAIAVIAGIGFTMSLFIGQLAFTDASLHTALKLGVLGGSLLSALVGFIALRRA